jgi:hypothetical protein
MRRNILAILAAVLAMGLILLGTYLAFVLLVPVVPRGTSLGLVLLVLGIFCVIGCAATGCVANCWLEGYPRSETDMDRMSTMDSLPSVQG